MQIVGASSEAEMVACFLHGEWTSARFGLALHHAVAAANVPEQVVTDPDAADAAANRARRDLLGAVRGYGQNRDLFDEDFPVTTSWNWALLAPSEMARVRYVYYDYWNELSDGTRLAGDAAERIRTGGTVFGVQNDRFLSAARAYAAGAVFPPLILAGARPDSLVCLEGNLRLTAIALAGFPAPTRCLVGTHPALQRWTH